MAQTDTPTLNAIGNGFPITVSGSIPSSVIPASISINSQGAVATSTATITGSNSFNSVISGVSGATFGAVTYLTSTTWSLAVSNLVVGSNTIIIRATATDYTFAEATTTITRSAPPDTTAPVTTASVLTGTYTVAQTVTLTANESATIYYTTDGVDPTYPASGNTQSATSPVQLTIPATGVTQLRYRSRDTAGNLEAVKIQTYTINPPVIPDPVLSTPNPTFDTNDVLFRITVANRLAGDTCVFQYQQGATWYDVSGGSTWITDHFEKLVSRSILPQTSLPTRAIVTRSTTTFYSGVVTIDLTPIVIEEPKVYAVTLPNGIELQTIFPPTDNEAVRMRTSTNIEVGLQLVPATDDAAGAVRYFKNGVEYSLKR